MDTLERAARTPGNEESCTPAATHGSLPSSSEAALLSANWYYHLFNDATYFDRARRAVRARLASEATPPACTWCPPTPKAAEKTTGRRRMPGLPRGQIS